MDFDLILMDIQMPIMDGIEATHTFVSRIASKISRNIPIIAMTAYAMLNDKEKFLAAGMDDYISKPVDSKILVELIDNILARKRNIPIVEATAKSHEHA
jgi:CheY-like chemotaxis protein